MPDAEGERGCRVSGLTYAAPPVYIVVYSSGPDAKILAHATNSKLVGMPLSQIVDENGKAFAVEISQNATADGGWFDYAWHNPVVDKVQSKEAWVSFHEGFVFLAGPYVE